MWFNFLCLLIKKLKNIELKCGLHIMWIFKYAVLLAVLLGTVCGDDWIMESNQ